MHVCIGHCKVKLAEYIISVQYRVQVQKITMWLELAMPIKQFLLKKKWYSQSCTSHSAIALDLKLPTGGLNLVPEPGKHQAITPDVSIPPITVCCTIDCRDILQSMVVPNASIVLFTKG